MFFKDDKEARETLEKFLSMTVKSSDDVIDAFAALPNAQKYGDEPLKRFVYIPGTRDDKVLLVAHADTIWDKNYMPELLPIPQKISYMYGRYYNSNPRSLTGIGADDRAGCAILYLLRNSGHSILIVDGEEHGQIGANYLKNEHPEIFEEINKHSFAIQFDRKNATDYKCYNIPVTNNFKNYLYRSLGYTNAGTKSKTDIVVLCQDICGANLSVGYYGEHTEHEVLNYKQWLNTYRKVSDMLKADQKTYHTKKLAQNDDHIAIEEQKFQEPQSNEIQL